MNCVGRKAVGFASLTLVAVSWPGQINQHICSGGGSQKAIDFRCLCSGFVYCFCSSRRGDFLQRCCGMVLILFRSSMMVHPSTVGICSSKQRYPIAVRSTSVPVKNVLWVCARPDHSSPVTRLKMRIRAVVFALFTLTATTPPVARFVVVTAVRSAFHYDACHHLRFHSGSFGLDPCDDLRVCSENILSLAAASSIIGMFGRKS
jgi:hypothetical protein